MLKTGNRRVGFGLRPAWLREAGVAKGDRVGVRHLDDGRLELVLDDYDDHDVDATIPVGRTGDSLTVDLDRASRHVLGEEKGSTLYASRRTQRRIIVSSAE